MVADWLVGARNIFLLFLVFGAIAIFAHRAYAIPRNLRLLADRFSLMFSNDSFGTASAWGTGPDGRRLNIYTLSKRQSAAGLLWLMLTWIPWPGRKLDFVEIGLHGAGSPDIKPEDTMLFNEYAARVLPAALGHHYAQLAAARMTAIECRNGLLLVRGAKFGVKHTVLGDAVEAALAVARDVELGALRELATVRGEPAPELVSATVADDPPADAPTGSTTSKTPEAVPESIVCPHCGARTPTDRGACQMCSRSLEAKPEPPGEPASQAPTTPAPSTDS
jgi:hypothetical protein